MTYAPALSAGTRRQIFIGQTGAAHLARRHGELYPGGSQREEADERRTETRFDEPAGVAPEGAWFVYPPHQPRVRKISRRRITPRPQELP